MTTSDKVCKNESYVEHQTRSRAGALRFFSTFKKAWDHAVKAQRGEDEDAWLYDHEHYDDIKSPGLIWKISFNSHRWVRSTLAGFLELYDKEDIRHYINYNQDKIKNKDITEVLEDILQYQIGIVSNLNSLIADKLKTLKDLQVTIQQSNTTEDIWNDYSERRKQRRRRRKIRKKRHIQKLLNFVFWMDVPLDSFEYNIQYGFFKIINVLTEDQFVEIYYNRGG